MSYNRGCFVRIVAPEKKLTYYIVDSVRGSFPSRLCKRMSTSHLSLRAARPKAPSIPV